MSALISFEFSMSLWPPWRQENTAEPVFVLCVVWHAASDCDLCSAQRFSSLGALMDQLPHDLPYGWSYPEGIRGPQCNCLQETESHPHLLSDHGSGSSLSQVFRWNLKPTDPFSEAQWEKGLFTVSLIGRYLFVDLGSVYSLKNWTPDLAHARQQVYQLYLNACSPQPRLPWKENLNGGLPRSGCAVTLLWETFLLIHWERTESPHRV